MERCEVEVVAKSVTICSADNGKGRFNSGTCNQIYYRDTTNDNSIGDTSKGAEVEGTTNDISTREITKGAEPRSEEET